MYSQHQLLPLSGKIKVSNREQCKELINALLEHGYYTEPVKKDNVFKTEYVSWYENGSIGLLSETEFIVSEVDKLKFFDYFKEVDIMKSSLNIDNQRTLLRVLFDFHITDSGVVLDSDNEELHSVFTNNFSTLEGFFAFAKQQYKKEGRTELQNQLKTLIDI